MEQSSIAAIFGQKQATSHNQCAKNYVLTHFSISSDEKWSVTD